MILKAVLKRAYLWSCMTMFLLLTEAYHNTAGWNMCLAGMFTAVSRDAGCWYVLTVARRGCTCWYVVTAAGRCSSCWYVLTAARRRYPCWYVLTAARRGYTCWYVLTAALFHNFTLSFLQFMHPELLQCIIDERVWHFLVRNFDFTNVQYLEEKLDEVMTLTVRWP